MGDGLVGYSLCVRYSETAIKTPEQAWKDSHQGATCPGLASIPDKKQRLNDKDARLWVSRRKSQDSTSYNPVSSRCPRGDDTPITILNPGTAYDEIQDTRSSAG